MRRAVAVLAGCLCLVVLAAACGGSDAPPPIRVGVLVECTPPLGGLREPIIAAVEAPLLRRGAKPAGQRPSQGLRGATIAERPVEIVLGCSELGAYSLLIEEARRLVEHEGVDVLIGGISLTEGVVLRRVAERFPDVTFVLAWSGASGATFVEPPDNFFRLGPSSAQSVAGLGAYAYRELGWRTAAIVADDHPGGWEGAAGFAAEFCALGGRIVNHDLTSLFAPAPDPADVRRAQAADGVGVFSLVGVVASLNLDGYMTAYAQGQGELSRRVVLGGPTFSVPENLDWAADSTGIVVAADLPVVPTADGRALARAIAEGFPGLPTGVNVTEGTAWFGEAAEAVVGALERVGGELSDGQRRFRSELASTRLQSARGPVRLDANRQGIVTTYLGRVERSGDAPTIASFREIRDVDRTLGGVLAEVPEQALPQCVRRPPPPWAS